jgi:hypothetical protein
MLVSVATTGCPRNASVHISASELSRAKPILARGKEGIVIDTSQGDELPVDDVRALGWTGDDTSRWTPSRDPPWALTSLARAPEAKPHPFYPPRGGTWTLEVPDRTGLSNAGKITTFVGAGASGLVLFAFVFTGFFLMAAPTINADDVFLVEGIAAISTVSTATLGGVLWAAGNIRFQRRQPDLGEGKFRW